MVQGGKDEADSEAESSSEVEESSSGSDEKVGMRKPSKKALENTMNEVSTVGDQ